MKCQNPGAYCTRDALPAAGSPQVTTSAWHRQWAERDWQVRAGLR